jgi:hypothetical protein
MKKYFQYPSNRLTFFLSPIILSMIISCESILFIELDEADKLIVLNGTISPDTGILVQVTRTRHILDNAGIDPLDKAKVRLLSENMNVEQLDYFENGYYASENFKPVVGDRYIIEVENPGYPSVSASCIIPEPVKIASIDTTTVSIDISHHEYNFGYPSYNDLLQFDLTIHDPSDRENFYLLNMLADRSRTERRDTTVVIVDSLYYGGQWNYFPKDSVYILENVVRFTEEIDIASDDIIVEATTSAGILFSDQLIDGKTYSFRGQIFAWTLESADSALVFFRLHSISESYYKYLKSRQKHYDAKDDYLAVPVIVFSNIESGTGFFGGYSSDVMTITAVIPEYHYYYSWY